MFDRNLVLAPRVSGRWRWSPYKSPRARLSTEATNRAMAALVRWMTRSVSRQGTRRALKSPVTAISTASPRSFDHQARFFGKDEQVLPRQVTGRQDGHLQQFRARGRGLREFLLGGELFQAADEFLPAGQGNFQDDAGFRLGRRGLP